jgi:hypothetical protein
MDKNEFDRLQTVSKECWAELSLTGETEKPGRMFRFLNSCPACQIANGADCRRCPVDLWRAIAVEESKMEGYFPGNAVCDEPDQWFFIWRSTGDEGERKEMARRISRMNWTYIPELHDPPMKEAYRVIMEVTTTEIHVVEAYSKEEAEEIALKSTATSFSINSKKVVQVILI